MIFDRQIAFWGEEKQRMLEQASVFVAGLGVETLGALTVIATMSVPVCSGSAPSDALMVLSPAVPL